MIKWTKEETILIIVEGYCILMYLFWFHVYCFVYYIIFFTSSEGHTDALQGVSVLDKGNSNGVICSNNF